MFARPVRGRLLGARWKLGGTGALVEDRNERERRERRLHQEDAAPAEQLREEPAERGPGAAPSVPANAQMLHGVLVAAAQSGEHRYRPGERERGAEALHDAARDQHVERGREARTTSEAAANTVSPIPARTWPFTRRSNGKTASAPITIATLYAVIVHDTATIETSNVP